MCDVAVFATEPAGVLVRTFHKLGLQRDEEGTACSPSGSECSPSSSAGTVSTLPLKRGAAHVHGESGSPAKQLRGSGQHLLCFARIVARTCMIMQRTPTYHVLRVALMCIICRSVVLSTLMFVC